VHPLLPTMSRSTSWSSATTSAAFALAGVADRPKPTSLLVGAALAIGDSWADYLVYAAVFLTFIGFAIAVHRRPVPDQEAAGGQRLRAGLVARRAGSAVCRRRARIVFAE
jgi:hypothetical protein